MQTLMSQLQPLSPTMAKKKRNRRIPEVLWRLFRHRARALSDTLISLIPPNHSNRACRCSADSSCLACCDDRYSFLIRPGDPEPYRRIMDHCFVVVPDAAPPLESWMPTHRISQYQIVKRTIEQMLCDGSNPSNVLCNGFSQVSLSSPVIERLTSSEWVILHDRVGDTVMDHLLRYTLVFLPDPLNSHFQVSGVSIRHLSMKKDRGSDFLGHGAGSFKKRKKNNVANSSLDSVNMHRKANYCGDLLPTKSEGSHLCEVSMCENLQHHASGGIIEPKKCRRQFIGQQIVKPRQSNLNEGGCYNMDSRSKRVKVAPCSNKKIVQDHDPEASIQCCCSFLIQTPAMITGMSLIDRQPMFHRADRSLLLLPKNHVLNKLTPSFAGANHLIGEIFGSFFRPDNCDQLLSSHMGSADSACLHRSLVKKMKSLIRRARSCEHQKLLNKHCPIQTTSKSIVSATEMVGDLEVGKCLDSHQNEKLMPLHEPINLFQQYCSKHQVASFIWAVCRSTIPPELLGTSSSWRTMMRNISIFIGLRRYEKFSLRQCMHKLKTAAFFRFFDDATSSHIINQTLTKRKPKEGIQVKVGGNKHKLQVKLLECWVYWLYTYLIIPVVQSSFYVTTTEQGKHDVFYYRKTVWGKLTERAISDLNGQTLHHLNVDAVRDIIRMRRFGFSKLRFLPKANGIRAIASPGACSMIPEQGWFQRKQLSAPHKAGPHFGRLEFQQLKSVNYVLRDLHVVLNDVRCTEPEKLGSSVFDYTDVYKRLCPFLISLRESTILPSAYIVVADVVKAFDSIDQNKLLCVMENVLDQDLYHLKKTYEVVCTKKSMWVHENILPENQTILRCHSLSKPSVPYRLVHSVLINKESSYHLQNKDLLSLLAEHVKRNVLCHNGKFYFQSVGISQGSILSSLLCSFYLAHLEKNVIYPFLGKACEAANQNRLDASDGGSSLLENDMVTLPCPKYVLMRFIDDFILITTSRKQATDFITRLQRGFREYNCYLNSDKWGLNFECDKISGASNSRLHAGDDGQSFLPWSGLLFNCQSLEIQADYSRYLKNHLCSTLTISWQNKPLRHLEQKLCGFMRPKCRPILFDQNINSEPVVRLNIYQIFLLAAMKFHCYVVGLSHFHKPQPAFSTMVLNSVRYLYTLIRRPMHRISSASSNCPILTLDKEEVEWLGLTAFSKVLKRKQSRHKELLSILRSKLKAHPISKNVPWHLEYAVNDIHSSVLWQIKY